MENTTKKTNGGIIGVLLRGAGQVMFQNNAWTGLFFLAGIFYGAVSGGTPLVAWGALLGLVVSTMTGYLLGLPETDGNQGLWGFNGILVGCAFPTFLGNTLYVWLALVLCAALTTWVRAGFNNILTLWRINSLTFPFVFCTWVFLFAARAMHELPAIHMSTPTLMSHFESIGHMSAGEVAEYWLRGISQVFLIDSWISGAIFMVGLLISSGWAAVWAGIGSALAMLVALAMKVSGYDIANGLYGFSAVLTAIALATIFYKPGLGSAIWAIVGIMVTVFIQAAMNVHLQTWGLPTLTGPFCITAWLFLLPMLKLDHRKIPDHSNWHKTNKTHLKN